MLQDQNERLIKVTQEKAKMEAKNKARQAKADEGNEEELTEFDIKKKEKEEKVAQLREKLKQLKETEEYTRNTYESEKASLDEHREQLKKIIETCKTLYSQFEDKRKEIKSEKAKRIRELTDPNHAWDAEEPTKGPSPVQEEKQEEEISAKKLDISDLAGEGVKYRALYDYSSENPDDLEFKAGDLIVVHPDQPHEPGWLGGELNGKVGWFPEAYAEVFNEQENNLYVALFAYQSDEPGDLVFEAGEQIEIIKKENEWWTGKIGERQGVFPYNYVEPVGAGGAENETAKSEETPQNDEVSCIFIALLFAFGS